MKLFTLILALSLCLIITQAAYDAQLAKKLAYFSGVAYCS